MGIDGGSSANCGTLNKRLSLRTLCLCGEISGVSFNVARDTKLNRKIALKILPANLAADQDHMEFTLLQTTA